MNKINIVQRRLDCQGVSPTQAELRAWKRDVLGSFNEKRPAQQPLLKAVEKAEDPFTMDATFLLSQEQASSFESTIESAETIGKEMTAVFSRAGSCFMLRLYAETPDKKKYLTSKDVSEMLSLSRRTIYRLVRQRRLTGYRIGAMLRFNFDDVRQFLSLCCTNPAQEREEGSIYV